MKELEDRLAELQERHDDLIKSYKSLQLEYSTVKQDLETLQRGKSTYESVSPATRSYCYGPREQEDYSIKISNPLHFGPSAFYYGQEEDRWPEGVYGLSQTQTS
jgi:AP-1-like factor